MIGRLTGILLEKQPPQLLLEVGGVGYEVEASMDTFYRLPEIGNSITLHTHFVVREDAQLLFGFYENRERILFRNLIKVNGVGPKLALTVLSSIEPDEFVRCILENDNNRLVRVPGIGKKTAERLMIEMRDRLKSWDGPVTDPNESILNMTSTVMPDKIREQEAINALVALGFKPQEASRAIFKFDIQGMPIEEIIRTALKGMVGQ